ncbi:hypothetical protein BTA51_20960 [Hahella sp. CCB-MM4]|uniref:DUF2333 family protein n=1 Tax=Hahella sp. (strain CCB-MM4) TaxID=1926491 RepID=UPI000B9B0166|nr:DUF2333 family protein [Hahella sp. CCB-MM4]OZG71410.1 hypothetical protein BTA51_20960 [Hahella sp. CCB-MM4]
MWQSIKVFFVERWEDLEDYLGGGRLLKFIGLLLLVYLLVALLVGWYWSQEPGLFDVNEETERQATELHTKAVVGSHTTATLIALMETLLQKNGGYISNDVFPPGLWLDNISNWEFGVLVQARDLSRALRKDISRSQSQSVEDKDLTIAEPQLHFDSASWMIPSTEAEYKRGVAALKRYMVRLADEDKNDGQFYARSDNLRSWLTDVETRLGSLSQRLSESVGKRQFNLDLAGDPAATQSKPGLEEQELKTPWLKVDDVFYEARGTAWALIHILKAIEVDFAEVLRDKNALVSLRQIIIELEATQEAVWSPFILNGSGFGVLANHSLTMASYISRANAAIIDLRSLLAQG